LGKASGKESVNQVIHIITTLMRGGAENQLLILASEQVSQGKDVHVFFLKDKSELAAEFKLSGASVHAEIANISPLRQVSALRKFLGDSRFKGAIVHGHLPRAQIIAALSVEKSQFLICSRHDEDKFFPNGHLWFSRLLFKLVDRKTRKWIAISQSVRESMKKYGENPKRGEIEVVHYGYRSPQNKLDSSLIEELRETYDIREEQFVVGCVARLVWQKDHATLLKAFAIYSPKNPKARLILIGDGPLRNQLLELARELGILDSVVFVGKVSNVREHLQLLDVFVLSSITEGFGLVLLEAMEAELPIIASKISVIPEVLGDSGLLFETGNPRDLARMIELLEIRQTRDNYSDMSGKKLKEYAPEIMFAKIENVYEKAVLIL
jgi:glycosyltransferase involved in cell wall biosynthesis